MTAVTAAEDRMRVLVEQAAARLEIPDEICDRLHVEPAYVDEVLHRLDVLNRTADVIGHSQPIRPAPCGTYAAYQRHRSHSEKVDPACRAARRRYETGRRITARAS